MSTSKYSALSDEKLMELFIGDRQPIYFTTLYNRYFSSLCKYMTWLTTDMNKSQDFAQNILLKIYHRPELFDSTQSFKPWLFTIARNHWKNDIRDQSTQIKHLALYKSIVNTSSTTTNSDHKEQFKAIQNAIKLLSDTHKEIIILKYSNNLTIPEISSILNCSKGTVKSRLFYALKHLRKLLIPQS